LAWLCLSGWTAWATPSPAAENAFADAAAPLFERYCFDCHSDDLVEADINLQRLSSSDSFAASFKDWQRVETMLQSGKMPPDDMPQPSPTERRRLVALVRDELQKAADESAGDPGVVVMRRLTSAEYAYTIRDLTSIDLDLGGDFVDDAVGGEGFANTGVAQFMQDATLERYLEAAKRVAAHAVVGAGPLQFFRDPGKTGLEVSAINRIQEIYRAHGFRAAAGEGGEPFGLDAYPKAFYAAWRYRHREVLGGESLADVAEDQALSVRFLEHIWRVLNVPSLSFPASEVLARWRALPAPDGPDEQLEQKIHDECDAIYRDLRNWQRRLARAASHNEEAPVLAAGATVVSDDQLTRRRTGWPENLPLEARRAGVLELANLLPQVSHREPAPSDRDPIPPPYDSTYNSAERNDYHYQIKYHRDDQFLVEHILDDVTRERLDQAWTDLLTSFEYHDRFLRFVAEKYDIDLDGRTVADVDDDWVAGLAEAPREYAHRLHEGYGTMQQALRDAESRHVSDALELAHRAWRRPLHGEEEARLTEFYLRLREEDGLDHPQAIRGLLTRILVAPDFLYRVERPSDQGEPAPLSDWELASRLSYFLWSTLPDEELRRAAAAGELRKTEELARQAKRMLADEKARRLATEFFGQWFGFYQFDRFRGIDPERFGEFKDGLKGAMYDEAISFFEYIVRQDRPVREILFADYAFVSDELAAHYGMEREGANESREGDGEDDTSRGQVENLSYVEGVSRYRRGGLLGLGAVLTVTSAPLRTSPVKRGDWVLRRVLGTPVPPPPPDAGSIAADDVHEDGLTVRERLEAHRRDASCAGCHSRIDPLGFALEHFDPLGRWRETYRDGQAIDASGTLSDGTSISGLDGLRDYLKANEGLFQRMFCTKLIGYALGRTELASDSGLVAGMMLEMQNEGRFSDLVVRIVTSRQFRSRPRSPNAASQRSNEFQ
jgi:hypothetical protein